MNLFRQLISRIQHARYSRKMQCGEHCSFGRHFAIKGDRNAILMGDNCYMDGVLYTFDKGTIEIGAHSSIRYNTRVGATERVTIGNYVIISNHVTIIDNNNHPTHPADRMRMINSGYGTDWWSWKYAKAAAIVIGDNVWIGERARICKGVTVGEGSVIAADAVVVHDVPANCIAAGNPAVVIRENIHLETSILPA